MAICNRHRFEIVLALFHVIAVERVVPRVIHRLEMGVVRALRQRVLARVHLQIGGLAAACHVRALQLVAIRCAHKALGAHPHSALAQNGLVIYELRVDQFAEQLVVDVGAGQGRAPPTHTLLQAFLQL